jgi:phage tail sheath gpL-like
MALQGIASTSPIPRRARQFAPASGTGVGQGSLRPVVLIGNKTSAGSEALEMLGGPILSLQDCYNRFGRRSEIAWMYRAYIAVDPNALIYAIAMAEGGGATASTCTFTFASASTTPTVVNIDSCKGRLQVAVAIGDSIQTIATNVVNAISADPDLPFSATVDTTATTVASGSNGQALPQSSISVASTTGLPSSGTVLIGSINALVAYTGTSGGNTLTGCTVVSGSGTLATGQTVTIQGQVDITTSQKGPRSAGWINNLRASIADPTNATTATKSSVTAGTTGDSCANAIAAVDAAEFTYHCVACTSTSSVTSSDGGVGQYAAYIASIVAPSGGKSSMLMCAVDGTSAQATAVTQSAAVNLWEGHCYRVHGSDWHTSMVAAHCTAVHRSTEVNYAGQNLAGWTNDSVKGTVFQIPDPFNKSNRPTSVDETTDLNGGVSTIGFRTDGTPYIVRSITMYSWTGSSSTSDYRAREGHIPSVLFKFWEDLSSLLRAQNQPNVAADPPQGTKPVQGNMYPSTVKAIANKLIADMCGPYQAGMALLDASVLPQMLAATTVKLAAAGFEVDVAIACVRHNLQDDALIAEVGPAY